MDIIILASNTYGYCAKPVTKGQIDTRNGELHAYTYVWKKLSILYTVVFLGSAVSMLKQRVHDLRIKFHYQC